MSQRVLVTNYKYNVSFEEYQKLIAQLAPEFAAVPGCIWKIWLIDKEKQEAGGVYLFEDDASLQDFKVSSLVGVVVSHPALSNFTLKERDILEDISLITRAPIMQTA